MKRLFIACVVLAGVFAACKEKKGDRCQIDDDCGDSLVCNKATNSCQETTGGGIDAMLPDAPRDAPPDI